MHHDVEEVGDGRLHRQGGHPRPTDLLGVHHPVRPRLEELGVGRLRARTSDDEDVGPDRAGGQRHVQVVGVVAERRHQGRRAVDARGAQNRIIGGIALHRRLLGGARTLRVVLDEHDVLSRALQMGGDRATDPSPPADDDVILHVDDPPLRATVFDAVGQAALDERLEEHAKGVEGGARAHEDDDEGRDLPGRGGLAVLAEPDRGDGGDRLVERVEGRQPEDGVREGAGKGDEPEHQGTQLHSAPGILATGRPRAQGHAHAVTESSAAPARVRSCPLPRCRRPQAPGRAEWPQAGVVRPMADAGARSSIRAPRWPPPARG